MTWGRLKALIELGGVKDADLISYVDIGEATLQVLDHNTPQDPDGLDIEFTDLADGGREVCIS